MHSGPVAETRGPDALEAVADSTTASGASPCIHTGNTSTGQGTPCPSATCTVQVDTSDCARWKAGWRLINADRLEAAALDTSKKKSKTHQFHSMISLSNNITSSLTRRALLLAYLFVFLLCSTRESSTISAANGGPTTAASICTPAISYQYRHTANVPAGLCLETDQTGSTVGFVKMRCINEGQAS